MNPFQRYVQPSAPSILGAASTPSASRAGLAARRRPALRQCDQAGAGAAMPATPHFPAQGEAGHLPAHGRRAAADGPVRLQAEDERVFTIRICPTPFRKGQRLTEHDLAAKRGSRSRRRSSSSRNTANPACGCRSCCRGRPRWWMICASSAVCRRKPSTTSRPSPSCRPAIRSPAGPVSAVGVLRPRFAQSEPADVRRPGRQADQHRAGAGHLRAAMVVGLSAGRTRGRLLPHRRRPDPLYQQSAWRSPRSAPQDSRRTQSAQRDELQNGGRSGDAHAHRAVRNGLPDAGQRPRPDRLEKEPENTFKLYGDEAKKPGTFANTALLARRMVERGVRFVQIYHNNWDTHGNVAGRLPDQCRDVDQACYGLVQDLKNKGLYDATLVIWGGEFGRTIYSQGGLSHENYGRDHHPRCYTMWMAGGGPRRGRFTAKPTISPTTSSKTPSTSTIFTPRSCACWASTICNSHTASRVWTSGLRAWCRRASCRN